MLVVVIAWLVAVVVVVVAAALHGLLFVVIPIACTSFLLFGLGIIYRTSMHIHTTTSFGFLSLELGSSGHCSLLCGWVVGGLNRGFQSRVWDDRQCRIDLHQTFISSLLNSELTARSKVPVLRPLVAFVKQTQQSDYIITSCLKQNKLLISIFVTAGHGR